MIDSVSSDSLNVGGKSNVVIFSGVCLKNFNIKIPTRSDDGIYQAFSVRIEQNQA
jgi:hypothetical protein